MATDELLAINGITDPRKLQVGQVLKVSGSSSATNVDLPAQVVTTTTEASSTLIIEPLPPATSTTTTTTDPIDINVVESEPLVEGEVTEIGPDMFEGAVEVEVIRLDAE